MLAAENGHIKTVNALIMAVANINAKSSNGWTALMWTAENGHTEIINALIMAGANINAEDKDGRTTLILAARNGHTETVNALIKAGADVNAKDKYGNTALYRQFLVDIQKSSMLSSKLELISTVRAITSVMYSYRQQSMDIQKL